MSISDKQAVANQYTNSSRLLARISIHEKYSRNKQPFGEWIVSHYQLQVGEKVLELGCGTGSMWQGVSLPKNCHVTLTDLFPGMLDAARENTVHLDADYQVCDVMEIPYAAHSFDVVIANMMLYHVQDIGKALQEIRRVLKPEGRFYAATFGEHGIVETVLDMLGLSATANHRFTLQNGAAQLSEHFTQVDCRLRDDALDVTNLQDLISYLRSMDSMTVLADIPDERLLEVFSANMTDGVLSLPKEYGLFVCNGENS